MEEIPKKFVLKCLRCSRSQLTTGISSDLSHLTEYVNGCQNCGRPRRFKCPHCGNIMNMLRIKEGR